MALAGTLLCCGCRQQAVGPTNPESQGPAATATVADREGTTVFTAEIAQLDKNIRQAQATGDPGGAGEPSAPQSVGAQLHHQPTPGSVQSAERRANADGDAALARARQADANGDAAACAKALREARDIYGF